MNDPEREETILRLQPMVRRLAIAACRQIPRVEIDDLVGDGYVGLIAAVDTFDASRGMTLESYARRKIIFAMYDGARRTDELSQCSRSVLRRAERDRYAFAVVHGRMPSRAELEARNPKLRSAQRSARLRRPLSLDAAAPVAAFVSADRQADPQSLVCDRETTQSVRDALGRLPERHRQVLRLYYGGGFRLEAVARRFSVTAQRIAQVRNDALASVRRRVLAS